jgi:pimeloyl-ACP methyl ester carboxylesterase
MGTNIVRRSLHRIIERHISGLEGENKANGDAVTVTSADQTYSSRGSAAALAPAIYNFACALPDHLITDSFSDLELLRFESEGVPELRSADQQGSLDHDGTRIWYSSHGSGPTVVLLHGELGHSGNWGYQVPRLLNTGYRVVLVDSRGNGRSTRDARTYSYELMAGDVLAVIDALHVDRSVLVGWSDGACTALVLARQNPRRVSGVFFFVCNMDAAGVKEFQATPVAERCFRRHTQDYARLSRTPDQFSTLLEDLGLMQRTQPNYTVQDLAEIGVPVVIAQSEHDEVIKSKHAEYLARAIPGARLVVFPDVSHFAPWQRPDQFSAAILEHDAGTK